jgi:hypothetical protein
MGSTLDLQQLKALLSLNLKDVLIQPLAKKEDAGQIKTIKLSDLGK